MYSYITLYDFLLYLFILLRKLADFNNQHACCNLYPAANVARVPRSARYNSRRICRAVFRDNRSEISLNEFKPQELFSYNCAGRV